jgi:acyl-coenzyme A thioesterase PaaI-like protein
MTKKRTGDDTTRDTEVPPPGTAAQSGKPLSVPPPPMLDDDDEPLVQDKTEISKQWVALHPWLRDNKLVVLRVTDRGESEAYIQPGKHQASPYNSANGGMIVTGCLAAAQMAGTQHFGEKVSVMTADAIFIAPSSLDLPVRFRAEFVKALSTSRILVDVTWYQIDTKELSDKGSMSVVLAKARNAAIEPALVELGQELLTPDDGEFTTLCDQLVATNPYFSHMGVNITHVSQERGVRAHLLPHLRNQNTQGMWADGVLNAMGDALVCYATVPLVGEAPTTSQLKFERIAQAPANAVLFGEAVVLDALPRRRAKVHGRAYYLNENHERVIVGLYESMIVGM